MPREIGGACWYCPGCGHYFNWDAEPQACPTGCGGTEFASMPAESCM